MLKFRLDIKGQKLDSLPEGTHSPAVWGVLRVRTWTARRPPACIQSNSTHRWEGRRCSPARLYPTLCPEPATLVLAGQGCQEGWRQLGLHRKLGSLSELIALSVLFAVNKIRNWKPWGWWDGSVDKHSWCASINTWVQIPTIPVKSQRWLKVLEIQGHKVKCDRTGYVTWSSGFGAHSVYVPPRTQVHILHTYTYTPKPKRQQNRTNPKAPSLGTRSVPVYLPTILEGSVILFYIQGNWDLVERSVRSNKTLGSSGTLLFF